MENKVIALDKAKIKLLVYASCASLAASLWLFSPSRIGVVLWTASIGFFAFCSIFGIKKLVDKKPGLVFSDEGLFDNASLVPVGNIPWSDITGVNVLLVKRQSLLVVKLVDPKKYIEDASNLKRKLRTTTFETYASPVVIPSSALSIDFNELVGIFNGYLLKQGKSA
jgi:hypothetical protein